MTRLITVAALFAAAVCAQATQKKSDKPSITSATSVSSVPKDAVKNADGTWNYTDKQGRKWVYVNTPFGIMKSDVTDAEGHPATTPTAATKVIDKGDTVRFEQPGPFGPIAWEKKKSDLTDQERQMVEAQHPSQTPAAKPETR